MRRLSGDLDAALAAVDAANAADPTSIEIRGERLPLALGHGRLASGWVSRLRAGAPGGASPELVIAARAHHLRRWELPRSAYPEGRAGYHRWKSAQRSRHAADVAHLLFAAGFDEASVARVQSLVRREHLTTDAEAQALEDAACLVFIETQLAAVSERFDRDHLLDVVRKTARKMSPAGLAATADLPIGDVEREILAAALSSGPSPPPT